MNKNVNKRMVFYIDVPVVEFEDSVEDSDCKGDSIVDANVAFPSEWDVVEASCEAVGPCEEAFLVHGVECQDHGVDHGVHSQVEAYQVSFLQVPMEDHQAHQEVAYLWVHIACQDVEAFQGDRADPEAFLDASLARNALGNWAACEEDQLDYVVDEEELDRWGHSWDPERGDPEEVLAEAPLALEKA